MVSFQGKPELITRCENCKAGRQRRSGKEDASTHLFFQKNASSDFTGNTIVKIEKGLVGT